MKFIIICALFAVVTASRNHHLVLVKTEIPTTEYREQDSKGFYSFGYSGEESAKAEYTTLDGSSKGFYSYIDSDGKLQTVKYEAGRNQGFTASATNLPVQPVDNSQPPEQVTDTPEVEIAKHAHFEAYREAALQAAMQPDTEELENAAIQQASAEAIHNAEFQQNAREQLLVHQTSRDQLLSLLREHEEERAREEQQSQLMTTYIISAQAEARSHGGQAHAHAQARIEPNGGTSDLRTLYSTENAESNVILKVGNDNGHPSSNENDQNNNGNRNEENSNGNRIDISNLRSINLWQDEPNVRNSQDTYFTVDNPNTHYTVEIPTVLTTLPRIESIRVGGNGHGHLPLAKSTTYINQRNMEGIHRRCVGIIVQNHIAACVIGSYPMSERSMMIKISAKPLNINIIQTYAPSCDRDSDEVVHFYEEISQLLKMTKSHEITIIQGDFNAKVDYQRKSLADIMNQLATFVSLFAVVWADSYVYPVPSQQLQSPILIAKSSLKQAQPQLQQYFTQDSLGQYSYGYSEPLSSKQEIRTFDGVTLGSYSYIDAHGTLQTVDYTADSDGFHVSATNLPRDIYQKPVTETPEVALARQKHLAAHEAILRGDISSSSILPQPVEDTPEVAAAKKEFLARFALEEEKHRMLRKSTNLKSHNSAVFNQAIPAIRSPSSLLKDQYKNGFPILPQRFYLPTV
ncbi:uncharacterized protein LOC142236013 [Haematobia irritans]|uniref:uncharacterized protein LOC142236013 n=1 Tax=Haematobia irritans TaxID=7368 RepID=UPI003F4FD5B9